MCEILQYSRNWLKCMVFTQTQTQRHRHTDTDAQTQTQTDRQTDRQTDTRKLVNIMPICASFNLIALHKFRPCGARYAELVLI